MTQERRPRSRGLLRTAPAAADPPIPLGLVYWVSPARVAIVPVKQPRDKSANQVGGDKHDWDRGYCQHFYRAPIDDGGALAMETARFRDIYNRIRPHQSLGGRTPRDAYLGITGGASVWGTVTETQHRAGLTEPCALGGSAAVLDA